ncbi:MAG: ABC transporter ATP-binding protein [Actinomycetota bacterium]|nr:ABC transporter ATP-binding protein [Actinomycetota bacterium]
MTAGAPTKAPVVSLRGASAGYEGRIALADVDLRVDPGEVVAVLGANGSGKSTLVRTIVGLLPLAAGSLELFGTPVRTFAAWPRLGYVPQRGGASTGVPATVREVVATGRLAVTGFRRMRTADREAVDRAIEAVGLAARAASSVATLSGGQQQRVLIARALTCDPDLLVMDEPTAGVDVEHQQALADTLGALVSRGTTIVLVSHELGPLRPLVTRAVTLAGGRVRHDGPPPGADHLHLHDPEHAHPVHAEVETSSGAWGLR